MRLQSNFLETLREYEMEPPQYLQEHIFESTIYSGVFSLEKVKDAEITPPPFLVTSIEKELGLMNTPATVQLFWIRDISMLKRICAAAAILTLIITTILYTKPHEKREPVLETKQETKAPQRIKDILVDSIQFVKPATAKASSRKKKTARSHLVRREGPKASILAYMPSEGDLWILLISFEGNSPGLENWMNTEGEKRITIDEYSTLHVSDKIVNEIKALYETKANGKPSRKAIKTKKRMEKWKRKDEQYFSTDKSPLDPIDLGKLLFKN